MNSLFSLLPHSSLETRGLLCEPSKLCDLSISIANNICCSPSTHLRLFIIPSPLPHPCCHFPSKKTYIPSYFSFSFVFLFFSPFCVLSTLISLYVAGRLDTSVMKYKSCQPHILCVLDTCHVLLRDITS